METGSGGEAERKGVRLGGQEELRKKSGVKVSDSAGLLQAPEVFRRFQSWVRCSPSLHQRRTD